MTSFSMSITAFTISPNSSSPTSRSSCIGIGSLTNNVPIKVSSHLANKTLARQCPHQITHLQSQQRRRQIRDRQSALIHQHINVRRIVGGKQLENRLFKTRQPLRHQRQLIRQRLLLLLLTEWRRQ